MPPASPRRPAVWPLGFQGLSSLGTSPVGGACQPPGGGCSSLLQAWREGLEGRDPLRGSAPSQGPWEPQFSSL